MLPAGILESPEAGGRATLLLRPLALPNLGSLNHPWTHMLIYKEGD